jgi:hypothetical protein
MRPARRTRSSQPNRRVVPARVVALQRPRPLLGLGREWLAALVALGLIAALVST